MTIRILQAAPGSAAAIGRSTSASTRTPSASRWSTSTAAALDRIKAKVQNDACALLRGPRRGAREDRRRCRADRQPVGPARRATRSAAWRPGSRSWSRSRSAPASPRRESILARARELGRQVIVAENYRFFPAERTVRKLLQDGFLGALDHATLVDRRHMPSHTEGPWLASIDYPQLQEVAIHHFDSLRGLFERRPTRITAQVWNPPWTDYRHGANTEALIDFGDLRAQYLGTLLSHRFGFSLWIEGEKGVLWTNRKYVAWRPKGSRWFRPIRNLKVPPGRREEIPARRHHLAPEQPAGRRPERRARPRPAARTTSGPWRWSRPPSSPTGSGGRSRSPRSTPARPAEDAAWRTARSPEGPAARPRQRRCRADRAVGRRGPSADLRPAAPRGPVAPAAHDRRGHARLRLALDLHRDDARPARPLPRLPGAGGRSAGPAHPARVVRAAAVLEVPRRRRPPLHRHGRVHGLPAAGLQGHPDPGIRHLDLVLGAGELARRACATRSSSGSGPIRRPSTPTR